MFKLISIYFVLLFPKDRISFSIFVLNFPVIHVCLFRILHYFFLLLLEFDFLLVLIYLFLVFVLGFFGLFINFNLLGLLFIVSCFKHYTLHILIVKLVVRYFRFIIFRYFPLVDLNPFGS